MPNRLARSVLGDQNAPTILFAGAPSLFWPLVILAAWRCSYAVDVFVGGSPTVLLAGGPGFSAWYAASWLVAAGLALAGTLVTAMTGRARLEAIGSILVLGGYSTLIGATVWNVWHGAPHASAGIWPTLGLATIPAWRVLNLASSHRPQLERRPLLWRGT